MNYKNLSIFSLMIVLFVSTISAEANKYFHQLPEDIVLGKDSAPITIIEYSSLSCPACAFFHEDILPEIEKQYINSGKVKFIFRNYPMHPIDIKAASTSLCAGPEKYYIFLKALFKTQKNWAYESAHQVEILENIGKVGGLSGEQIQKCLEDKDLENKIIESRRNAQNEIKINSTPTLIIDGQLYSGGLSKKRLLNAINSALTKH